MSVIYFHKEKTISSYAKLKWLLCKDQLWRANKDANERINIKFPNKLDAIIDNANKGDLLSTFNLFKVFCSALERSELPHKPLTKFVIDTLIRKDSKRHKKLHRKSTIKNSVVFRLKKNISKEADCNRSLVKTEIGNIAARFGESDKYIENCYYGKTKPPPVIKLFDDIKMGVTPTLHDLLDIHGEAKNLYLNLLPTTIKAKKLRTKLKLTRTGFWHCNEARNYEIFTDYLYLQDKGLSQIDSYKHLSFHFKEKVPAIKKIIQRIKKKTI